MTPGWVNYQWASGPFKLDLKLCIMLRPMTEDTGGLERNLALGIDLVNSKKETRERRGALGISHSGRGLMHARGK